MSASAFRCASSYSLQEVQLNWSKLIRQTHRWLSIAFTVTVIANFFAMSQGEPPAWVTYSPLLPLALLLLSGLYMFVLPYTRNGRNTSAAQTTAQRSGD
jgi:cellulose synthase/poly-beta-1,6-N-acetylglucosamine synthase-like glycosyltransferase